MFEHGYLQRALLRQVQQRRWKADINARLDASLLLSSVNLVGGELRRRSEQDELAMRKYLVEGDLISAEVQNLYNDGSSTLHTRFSRLLLLSTVRSVQGDEYFEA